MKLTIGMAVYRDYAGVWETVQHLRLIEAASGLLRGCEIVIVDNCPDSEEGALLFHTYMAWWAGPRPDGLEVRYVPMPRPVGTSAPRQRVFDEARGEVVVCLDSHVLLWAGALRAVLDFFADPAHARDMLSGPMVYDDLATVETHFDDRWRGEMWGTWGRDPRGLDPSGAPFEVWGQGLGCFAMRKDAWVGFNPRFLGFGGEEGYVHEKVRRRGGRVFCHPAMRWVHRFGRPGGPKYPVSGWYMTRNYVLGLTELGLPLDRLHRQMVLGVDENADGSPAPPRPRMSDGRTGARSIDHLGWALLTADPANPPDWPPDQPLPPELLPAGDALVPAAPAIAAPHGAPPDGVAMWEPGAPSHYSGGPLVAVIPPPAKEEPAPPPAVQAPGRGPGTELKKLLAALGLAEKLGCECNGRAVQMDLWGVAECREHRAEIVGWLKDGAAKFTRKQKRAAAWKMLATGLAFKVNWLDPLPGLVEEAIRRAERAAA